MELDNLKQAWKEQVLASPPNGDDQILSMLRMKSQSPISKMKRNLMWELIAVAILYIGTIAYYLTAQHGRYWELALLLLLVGLIFVFYYYRKNKLLTDMECVTCEVKSNLQRQVSVLEKYIRFYFVAGTLLTPVCYFTSGIIVAYKQRLPLNTENRFLSWFVIIGIVITVLVYFLNIWYVNKLYGQHVKKLKLLLKQTEEQN